MRKTKFDNDFKEFIVNLWLNSDLLITAEDIYCYDSNKFEITLFRDDKKQYYCEVIYKGHYKYYLEVYYSYKKMINDILNWCKLN